jgi:hypothetical protein
VAGVITEAARTTTTMAVIVGEAVADLEEGTVGVGRPEGEGVDI